MAKHLPPALRAIGAGMLSAEPKGRAQAVIAATRKVPAPAAATQGVANGIASPTVPGPAQAASPGKAPLARPTLTAGGRHFLDAFSQAEGTDDATARRFGFASGYDVPGGYRRTERPLTSMTLDEVMKFQRDNGGPAGRYQAMRSTLGDFKAAYRLTGQEKFDSTLQDQFGAYRLNYRGYGDPKISPTQLQTNMAAEWASIEDPEKKTSRYTYTRKDKSGRVVTVPQPVKMRSDAFQSAAEKARQIDGRP